MLNSSQWYQMSVRESDFFTISKRLSEFLRRDFSCIQDIMRDLFPMSYDRRLPRDVPLVESIAKQHSIWYRRPPQRDWRLPTGEELTTNQIRTLRRLYQALDIDGHMRSINEMVVVQSTVLGVVMPQPGTNLIQIMTFEPWECEVDPAPLQSTDVQACARDGEFRFRIPVRSSFDKITFGTMTINSEKAVYNFDGKEVGIYREDGKLPPEFGGQVPIFSCRLGMAYKGDFFAPLKTDIYDAQVATSVAFSDLDFAARFGAWGQKVVTNATRPELEEMVMGPDRVIALMEDQQFQVVSGGNKLDDYQKSQEAFIKYVATHNSLNPATFTSQGQATAVSKMLDLHDRDSIRQDQLLALRQCENELYAALRLVLNAGIKSDSWPTAQVTVDYKETPLPENKLQMQQAQRMTFEDGLSSPARELAKAQGISIEEARRIVAENLDEYRAIKVIMEAPANEV